MKQIITTVSIAIMISSYSLSQGTNEKLNSEKMELKTELTNKAKASALLKSLETGDQTPVSYINPQMYIQHNLLVADGLKGFGEVLQHAPKGGFKANVVRSFQDGDYTFSHTIYDFFGSKIGFDIFRFEDGKIVEHWDNLSEIAAANPSNRTQTDGTTKLTDLDKTIENKALVKDFINTVLVSSKFDKLGNYLNGNDYIQHNSMISDGISGLEKALEEMAKNGITIEYEKIHIILGEGNFVLSVGEGKFAGNHTSFYDLFRIENGKIAEHWDVIETILPTEEHKNENGKFNF